MHVADPADAWVRAGFAVDPDGVCRIGEVRLRLLGGHHRGGMTGWTLRGIPLSLNEIDGIPAAHSDAPVPAPAEHPNGVIAIDHLVLFSPDLARTVAALRAIGVEPRRERDSDLGGRPIRQIFFRFGSVIIEAIGAPESNGTGPCTLWGITYAVTDIDRTAAFFADRTAPIKAAVQPGRRITTLRHQEFGMSVRTAMIS